MGSCRQQAAPAAGADASAGTAERPSACGSPAGQPPCASRPGSQSAPARQCTAHMPSMPACVAACQEMHMQHASWSQHCKHAARLEAACGTPCSMQATASIQGMASTISMPDLRQLVKKHSTCSLQPAVDWGRNCLCLLPHHGTSPRLMYHMHEPR